MTPTTAAEFAADICARVSRLVPKGETICVGLSGGLDSTVLLDALSENAESSGYPVSAVHVNHNLSPNAGKWVKFYYATQADVSPPESG